MSRRVPDAARASRAGRQAADRARAPRRGLTLLEILIAIAILVSLAAITMSSLRPALDERSFETGVDLVVSHLLLARAEAQTTRRAIAVTYRPAPSRLIARPFDVGGDPDAALPALAEGWADRALPDEVRITRTPPSTEDGSVAGGFARSESDGEPLRLAVYLPDGSSLLATAVWVRGPGGRLGRLAVDAWTGQPAFTRVRRDPGAGGPDDAAGPASDPFLEDGAADDDRQTEAGGGTTR